MTKKHIVLVDGIWAGHHPFYLKAFAKVLLEAGYRVSALCPAPGEMSDWFAGRTWPEQARFDAHHFSRSDEYVPGPWLRRMVPPLACLARWRQLGRALQTLFAPPDRPDMVILAWLDSYLQSRYLPAWLVDRMFPYAWSGLYFHPRHHRKRPQGGSLPCPERLLAKSRHACGLAILDAGVADKVRAGIGEKPLYVFPDFSDEMPARVDDPLAAQIRQAAGNRKIVGLLGSLERRKGVMTLLEMSRRAQAQGYYFVFAGELVEQTFSPQELAQIRQLAGERRDNCLVRLGRIPDDAQFNALVDACDVVFAVYENFPHSSNLITRAAAHGKPLLVGAGGYMEEVVRQFELGEVIPAGNVDAAIEALERLSALDADESVKSKMQAYADSQSQHRLARELLGLVESCSG